MVNGDKGVVITCFEGVVESLTFFPVVAAADSVLPLNAEYVSPASPSHGTYVVQKTIAYPMRMSLMKIETCQKSSTTKAIRIRLSIGWETFYCPVANSRSTGGRGGRVHHHHTHSEPRKRTDNKSSVGGTVCYQYALGTR